MTCRIRAVEPADLAAVVTLVHELAAVERAPEKCHLTRAQLAAALFGPEPALFGHVAVLDAEEIGGVALWFLNFSTWRGEHGIYLEDLYVRPQARGAGVGRALLTALAGVCVARGYQRLEWSVLDWNEPALRFYRTLGAEPMNEWTVWRLDVDTLAALAGSNT